MIKVNRLNKYFNKGKSNELHVINDTTIEFGNTGLVCIHGESGSGKTTFLNTVGGLDTFQGGSITIDNNTLSKYIPREVEELRNSRFAYIFQEQYLLQDYTVAYNIRLALYMSELTEEEMDSRIDYVLSAVDMKKYKKRLVSQLSGGQQQRIAIARALVKSPEVIFADEPTGNLDEANTMRVMSIIKKISKDCLVILVTHEKRIAEFFADRIIQIQDGKITGDTLHKGRSYYQRKDDTNLYLKEFETVNYHNGYFNINFYCRDTNQQEERGKLQGIDQVGYFGGSAGVKQEIQGNNSEINSEIEKELKAETRSERKSSVIPDIKLEQIQDITPDITPEIIPEIKLNIVYLEGKLYIQAADDSKVVVLNQTTEMQLIDDKKPELELDEAWDFDYSLPKLTKSKSSNLSWKEIYLLAKANLAMLGKKQIFIVVTLIITSILLVWTVADYTTMAAKDKKSIVVDDSNYLDISARRNNSADNAQYYSKFSEIFSDFLSKNVAQDIYIELSTKLYFNLENSFGQIKWMSKSIPDCSYVTIEHLKPEELYLGRMPENRTEIVIDKWLTEVFFKEDKIFRKLMKTEDFLGLELTTNNGQNITIVGISDSDQPTIYLDKYLGISLAPWADAIASLDQLKASNPGSYNITSLAANEALVAETVLEEMEVNDEDYFTARNGVQYKVVGTFPDNGIKYVIDDTYYKKTLYSYISTNRRFKVYGKDKEKVISYFALENRNYDPTYVEITVSDKYQEKMNEFDKKRAVTLDARLTSTLCIFAVSLFMLYFIMKSNALRRIQEIAVYRMIGITRKSIMKAFILEVIFITSYTILPTVLLLSAAIKLITAIPSLELSIYYPWHVVAGLLAFLYLVNIIIGVIPVYQIVKLPPAQLVEKV